MSDSDKNDPKQLRRDTSNRWIAGLCSGIGRTYNVDPLAVRLCVFFITFITGVMPGVITYLLGWLLTPAAEGSLARQVKEGVKNL